MRRPAVPVLAALASLLEGDPARAELAYVTRHSGIASTGPGGRASFDTSVSGAGTGRYLVVVLSLPDTSSSITGASYAGAPLTRWGARPGAAAAASTSTGRPIPPPA